MAGSRWVIAVSVVRKLFFAAAIPFAAVVSHMRWGFEYTGQGMHQVSLLFTVGLIATACGVLFLFCAGTAAWLLRRKRWPWHWSVDAIFFSAWCALAVWVAVAAEIVDE